MEKHIAPAEFIRRIYRCMKVNDQRDLKRMIDGTADEHCMV